MFWVLGGFLKLLNGLWPLFNDPPKTLIVRVEHILEMLNFIKKEYLMFNFSIFWVNNLVLWQKRGCR